MKYLMICLLAFSSVSIAEEVTCEDIGELSEKIMEARQLNIPISNLLKPVNGNELFTTIILDAYESTAFRAEENRKDAAARFRNKWELACIKVRQ